MKLPKLELKNKPPFIFWVIFGIIVLFSGVAIWEKWGFDYEIVDIPTNVSNPVNSRDYCQQDSDCVLAAKYQSCCPNACNKEAVNIETKKSEEETRNKQCGTKNYNCPEYECSSSAYNKQAVCEQNRCVVKEKLITKN